MTTESQTQPPETPEPKPCPLDHPVKNGLHFRSSSGMRKWHITCFDCGLELEGNLDETARELFGRWNTRADLPRAVADDDAIQQALRPISGCATDDQYVDVFERVTALVSTPRAETGLTVEAARQELRKMFPNAAITIEVHDYAGVAGKGCVKVFVDWRSTTHPTLDACMEIARRRWAKSRAGREGERT